MKSITGLYLKPEKVIKNRFPKIILTGGYFDSGDQAGRRMRKENTSSAKIRITRIMRMTARHGIDQWVPDIGLGSIGWAGR